MKFLRNFVSAFLGGISVSLGCAAYYLLKDTSPVIASLMFSVGFLVVAVFNFGLFTDRAGHLFGNGKTERNFKTLLISLLGNVSGSLLCGVFFINKLYSTITVIFQEKITSLNVVELFIGSLLCGVLIYTGLHGFRKAGSGFTGSIMLIGSTTLIGLCGFEYSLFNVFLTGAGIEKFSSYSNNALSILALWLISAIGNALGAILFAYLCRFKDSEESHSSKHDKHHHRSDAQKENNTEKAGE